MAFWLLTCERRRDRHATNFHFALSGAHPITRAACGTRHAQGRERACSHLSRIPLTAITLRH
eukprot:1987328-Prymnesium_polylepis.1